MGRVIKYIVIHCTATAPNAQLKAIQNYWREKLGWKSPGYHYLVEANGEVNHLLAEDKISNGVAGYNANSIHLSYIGGVGKDGITPQDTRTPQQTAAMITLLRTLRERYPDALVLGHRDFPGVKKACPSFDVKAWLQSIDL